MRSAPEILKMVMKREKIKQKDLMAMAGIRNKNTMSNIVHREGVSFRTLMMLLDLMGYELVPVRKGVKPELIWELQNTLNAIEAGSSETDSRTEDWVDRNRNKKIKSDAGVRNVKVINEKKAADKPRVGIGIGELGDKPNWLL